MKDHILLESSFARVKGKVDAAIDAYEKESQRMAAADRFLEGYGPVQEFIELVQKKEHEENIGKLEKLLTAALRDVLPSNTSTVKIQVDSKSGKPCVTFFSQSADGLPELITSGAKKNIFSVVLRVISILKQGGRRILVLDEADHWIAKDQVDNFASFCHHLSVSFGFQIVFISHNELSHFADKAHCVSLFNEDGKVEVRYPQGWHQPVGDRKDGQDKGPYIRAIRLLNCEAHKNTLVHLEPGLNLISGQNDIGKSAIIRGFSYLLNGTVPDEDLYIHHNTLSMRVEINDGNTWIGVRRAKKINQAMRYRVRYYSYCGTAQDSCPDEENFSDFEDLDRSKVPPEWVFTSLDIRKNPVEVYVAHQNQSEFIMDENSYNGMDRATILTVGNESIILNTMLKEHADMKKAMTNQRRDAIASMKTLLSVVSLRDSIRETEDVIKKINTAYSQISELNDVSLKISELNKKLELFAKESGEPITPVKPPVFSNTRDLRMMLSEIVLLGQEPFEKIQVVQGPAIPDTEKMQQVLANIQQLESSIKIHAGGHESIKPVSPVEFNDLSSLKRNVQTLEYLRSQVDSDEINPVKRAELENLSGLRDTLSNILTTIEHGNAIKQEFIALSGQKAIMDKQIEGMSCPVCHSPLSGCHQ